MKCNGFSKVQHTLENLKKTLKLKKEGKKSVINIVKSAITLSHGPKPSYNILLADP